MLFYPAALPLSTATLTRVAGLIRGHRRHIGSRWRTLDPGQQALLTLAHLHKGERLADLAAGFGISAATACRRIRETIGLLAARAPGLQTALRQVRRAGATFVILDGTLIRIRRNRVDQPFYSGKRRHHGMNLQAVTDERGELLWISGAIPGSIHDTAARIWQIPRLLREADLFALGDKDYRGLDDGLVITPFWGKGKPEWQKEANRLHARLRAPGERAFAQLKKWSIFDLLRCAPDRTTEIAKAVQVLNDYETQSG
ncbi:IS5/IS1182 family transposase [Glycomyces halotolerans]